MYRDEEKNLTPIEESKPEEESIVLAAQTGFSESLVCSRPLQVGSLLAPSVRSAERSRAAKNPHLADRSLCTRAELSRWKPLHVRTLLALIRSRDHTSEDIRGESRGG